MNLKKVLNTTLLVAAGMIMGATSAWGEIIETVGKTDKSSENNVHSETPITLKQGETKIITFNNYGASGESYYNWRIQAKLGSTVKCEVRADAYDNTSAAKTSYDAWNYQVSSGRGGDKAFLDWGTFKTDMQTASCLATITYGTDGTLSLRATSECSTGRIYYHGHDVAGLDGSDVDIVFYVDHSYLEITSITSTKELVGAIDYTNGYGKVWNEASKIWINPGEKAYYKFKNYNKLSAANGLYNNWCVWAATEASENLVIFCHDHSNTAANATYVSKPTLTMADLDGATIELTAELTDAGDGTYTFTCTAVTTKADGTVVTPNLVYTQTKLNASKLKMYISPDANWLAVLEAAVKKNISSAGWATFCSSNALDCANLPTGVTAYKVSAITATSATLEPVTEAVAAGTGLILSGTAGTYSIPVAASGSDISATNKLKGAVTATTLADGTFYILQGGKFHLVTGAATEADRTVPAGKAYLLKSDIAGAPSLNLVFGEETTGINTVTHEIQNGEFYNLNGQRIATPTKGLYIINGKKIIVK